MNASQKLQLEYNIQVQNYYSNPNIELFTESQNRNLDQNGFNFCLTQFAAFYKEYILILLLIGILINFFIVIIDSQLIIQKPMKNYKCITFTFLNYPSRNFPLYHKTMSTYSQEKNFNNKNPNRGKFIVLEGLDRSGKSSTTKSVLKFIQQLQPNSQVYATGFPNRTTKIGQMIDQFLKNKATDQLGEEAVHLLFSANRWECMSAIREKLNQGVHVVCDRYWYSGVAYSSAKQNKNMSFSWCVNADKGLQQPDLIIYLRGDAQILAKRQAYGQQRFQRVDFQKKVGYFFDKLLITDKFQQQQEKENSMMFSKQQVKVINIETKQKQVIDKQVKQIISELLS